MRHLKHSSLVIIAIIVVIFALVAQNAIGNNYYIQSGSNSQTSDSVVYVKMESRVLFRLQILLLIKQQILMLNMHH